MGRINYENDIRAVPKKRDYGDSANWPYIVTKDGPKVLVGKKKV